jgi:putative ABC transport system permease protein
MIWRDNLRIAIAGATSNKLRSLLTILGVLIGVGAVIILVAVGTGSSAQVQANIDRLGTNTLTVLLDRPLRRALDDGNAVELRDDDARRRPADRAPALRAVGLAGELDDGHATYNGASDSSATVTGSTPVVPQRELLLVEAGSSFTQRAGDEPRARRGDRSDRRLRPLRDLEPDRPARSSSARRASR